jgi:hypothetical protein
MRATKMKKTFLLLVTFSAIFSQPVTSQIGRPYLNIEREIEGYLLQKYSKEYIAAVDPFDTLLVHVRDAVKDEEFLDTYGTLKGKMFFQAWEVDENDMAIPEAKEIFGFSLNGSVLWDSGPLCTSGGAYVLGSCDLNKDGEIDVLVSMRDADRDRDYLSYLWIFSWNGTRARILNGVDPQTGQSVLLSGDDWYQLFDWDGDGIMEIWAFWDKENALFPDTLMSTRPYVTYSYNGSLYGLWPNTVQVPSSTFLANNRLSVKPSCRVARDGLLLSYRYRWSNDSTSKQKIRSIFLQGVDQEAIMISPTGWLSLLPTRPISAVLWDLEDSQKRHMIKAGQIGEGFELRDNRLPVIVRYYIKGYAPSSTLWGEEQEHTQEEVRNDLLTNSVIGFTIGPDSSANPFTEPADFLDTLTSFTTQSRTLGWITSQTVADKYLGYFSSAKTQLEQNNIAGARTTLQSVLHDVDVDSSSTLTSEAYALLRYNTEYLLDQLPAQSQEPPFAAQVDSISASLATAYANGWIGAKAFVNSLDRQLANARKNLEKGNLTRASALLQNFLNRLQKVYRNTLQREQKGKRRPVNFVTQEGFTYLSGKTSELLTKLGSLGEIVSVPGQFTTIQAAINAAKPGATIEVDAGTYKELVEIQKKDSLTLLASENVTIQGVRIARSNVITVKGFTIDAAKTNKDAVQIEGQENTDITIEANEIVNSSKDGISTGKHNVRTRIVNNVIAGNEKNGIDFADGTDGAQYIINNTIVKNGWNGVEAASQRNLYLVNNIISFNGTAKGDAGGRYGVKRDNKAGAGRITLLNNLIVGNDGKVNKRSSKDIANFDEVLDGADGGNITTTGAEGVGVSGSSAQSFSEVLLPDYRLDETSIAIDKGIINFAAPDLEAGMLPDEDIDGSPRPQRTGNDLGAFELE